MGYERALDGLLPNEDVWVTNDTLGTATDDPPRESPRERRRRREAEQRRMREEAERPMREERARKQSEQQSANERAMIERYGLSEQPCKMNCGRQALKGKPSCAAHTPIDTDIRLANL